MDLPISINPLDFGFLLKEDKFEAYIQYVLQTKDGQDFIIHKFENHNEVELFKAGISLVKFTDTNLLANKFIRTINNKKYWDFWYKRN